MVVCSVKYMHYVRVICVVYSACSIVYSRVCSIQYSVRCSVRYSVYVARHITLHMHTM